MCTNSCGPRIERSTCVSAAKLTIASQPCAAPRDGVGVGDVADDELRARVGEVRGVPRIGQLVEDDDLVTACDEPLHEVRADEAGAARHENAHRGRVPTLDRVDPRRGRTCVASSQGSVRPEHGEGIWTSSRPRRDAGRPGMACRRAEAARAAPDAAPPPALRLEPLLGDAPRSGEHRRQAGGSAATRSRPGRRGGRRASAVAAERPSRCGGPRPPAAAPSRRTRRS